MTALAPFVMKLKFYLPNNENQQKNVANLRYITRSGAIDQGEIEPEEVIHAQYMGERPGSLGLFGPNGPADMELTKDALRQHEGIVWRMIVSLREDEAVRINHIDRAKWEESLQNSFEEMGEKLGIPQSNVRWVAAYHPEPGHPHCHCIFWDAEANRKTGRFSRGEYKDVKKALVKNIYSQERDRLLLEKTFLRDNIRKSSREEIQRLRQEINLEESAVRSEVGSAPELAPRLDSSQEYELRNRLQVLSQNMPGHGRVALRLMPEGVKAEAREIADWILSQPGFIQEQERYLQAHREITCIYTQREEQVRQAVDKAYNDIRDRIAQEVLKEAVHYEQREGVGRGSAFGLVMPLNVWKGAWQSIQRERSKSEYQARRLQAQREYEEKEQKRREGRDR